MSVSLQDLKIYLLKLILVQDFSSDAGSKRTLVEPVFSWSTKKKSQVGRDIISSLIGLPCPVVRLPNNYDQHYVNGAYIRRLLKKQNVRLFKNVFYHVIGHVLSSPSLKIVLLIQFN